MKSPLRPAALLFVGLLALSACQPSASESPQSEAPASAGPSGEALSGDIAISGSSTVLPISNHVFEAFTAVHPDVDRLRGRPGHRRRVRPVLHGEIDIADASRTIATMRSLSARTAASSTSS